MYIEGVWAALLLEIEFEEDIDMYVVQCVVCFLPIKYYYYLLHSCLRVQRTEVTIAGKIKNKMHRKICICRVRLF